MRRFKSEETQLKLFQQIERQSTCVQHCTVLHSKSTVLVPLLVSCNTRVVLCCVVLLVVKHSRLDPTVVPAIFSALHLHEKENTNFINDKSN